MATQRCGSGRRWAAKQGADRYGDALSGRLRGANRHVVAGDGSPQRGTVVTVGSTSTIVIAGPPPVVAAALELPTLPHGERSSPTGSQWRPRARYRPGERGRRRSSGDRMERALGASGPDAWRHAARGPPIGSDYPRPFRRA